MLEPTNLAVFVAAVLLLALTPGPDMLYIIARSAGQGRRAGVISALGIGAGIVVHTLAATLGLSAILMSSALAFEIIKYLGAVYLIYLGIRILFSKEETLATGTKLGSADHRNIFTQALLTNILNPKVALFFLAFLPQFVTPSHGSIALQFLFYGTLFNLIGTSFNTGVAMLAGFVDVLLRKKRSFIKAQKWVTGSIFIGLGLRLALLDRR